MSNPDKLAEAAEIVAKARNGGKTIDELIDEKLENLKNLDLMAEISQLDEFDEITNRLSKDEKEHFDKETDILADTFSGVLDSIAETLKDPEARVAIIEELKRRVG